MRAWRTDTGFTLLEVVVAVAVLGIVLAVAFELLGAGLRSARTSAEVTQAVILARQKLDELLLQQRDGGSVQGKNLQGESEGNYRWSAQIVPDVGGPEAGAAVAENLPARVDQIKVSVSWPAAGSEKSLELTTFSVAIDEGKLPAVVPGRGSSSAGSREGTRAPGVAAPGRGSGMAQGLMMGGKGAQRSGR